MRLRLLWIVVAVSFGGCGDDTADAEAETDASTGTTGTSGSASTSEVTGTETTGPTADASSSTEGSGSTSGGMEGGESGSEGSESTGGTAEIVVRVQRANQPVFASAEDGSLIERTSSDGEALVRFDGAGVASITTVEDMQWSTIYGVEPGDEIDMRWRQLPDPTVLGQLTLTLPAADAHPDPDNPGFTQFSIGCADTLGGAPPGTETVQLDISQRCVAEDGNVDLIAYAQGGPNITILAYAVLPDIAWAPDGNTEVELTSWTTPVTEYPFSTTDPLANPVVNTDHSQWFGGVEFPVPRRSGAGFTRLFPIPELVTQMQFTGQTDLGDGSSHMFFGRRVDYVAGGYDLPVSDLLLPAITSTAAFETGAGWQLELGGPEPFDDADAILLQTRWLDGFWAVMFPPDRRSVVLPTIPDDLVAAGPPQDAILDTPFAVVAETDAHDDYGQFRLDGAHFFSGPAVVPGEQESLVRGAVYFPFPF